MNPGEDGMGEKIQTGALPWRRLAGGGMEVLLVTSRLSGRWIVPKGWPMPGKSLAQAAAQEAFEEAGVTGKIDAEPLGFFQHVKNFTLGQMEVTIFVHPLAVEKELSSWPERGQRQRKWFEPKNAARVVESNDLGSMILKLCQDERQVI